MSNLKTLKKSRIRYIFDRILIILGILLFTACIGFYFFLLKEDSIKSVNNFVGESYFLSLLFIFIIFKMSRNSLPVDNNHQGLYEFLRAAGLYALIILFLVCVFVLCVVIQCKFYGSCGLGKVL